MEKGFDPSGRTLTSNLRAWPSSTTASPPSGRLRTAVDLRNEALLAEALWSIEQPFMLPGTQADARRREAMLRDVEEAMSEPRRVARARRRSISDAEGLRRCTVCLEFKAVEDFYRASSSRRPECKVCTSIAILAHRRTLRGYLGGCLRSAGANAKARAERGRTQAGTCDMRTEDLLELYLAQDGRCAYSGVVLSARSYSNWQCSLERVDTSLGYNTKNTVQQGEKL